MSAARGAAFAYVGIGSNLGDPLAQLQAAVRGLVALGLRRCSSYYRSEPLGEPGQPWYLNAVAELETALGPPVLLRALLDLELAAGRPRQRERWVPRVLDLDLLLLGACQLETPELTLPHPRLAARRFVLEPLAELAPDALEPRTGKQIRQLLAELEDPLRVEKLPAKLVGTPWEVAQP